MWELMTLLTSMKYATKAWGPKVSMKYITFCPSCDSIELGPWMQLWVDINCYGAAYILM